MKVKEWDLVERWSYSIRNHCMKHGIYVGMPLPGTCEIQLMRDHIKNPIDNKYYRRINKGPLMSSEERAKLDKEHSDELRAAGIMPRGKKEDK